MATKLEFSDPSFEVQTAVKQGDTLSPKLFTSTLEHVFQIVTPLERKGKMAKLSGTELVTSAACQASGLR